MDDKVYIEAQDYAKHLLRGQSFCDPLDLVHDAITQVDEFEIGAIKRKIKHIYYNEKQEANKKSLFLEDGSDRYDFSDSSIIKGEQNQCKICKEIFPLTLMRRAVDKFGKEWVICYCKKCAYKKYYPLYKKWYLEHKNTEGYKNHRNKSNKKWNRKNKDKLKIISKKYWLEIYREKWINKYHNDKSFRKKFIENKKKYAKTEKGMLSARARQKKFWSKEKENVSDKYILKMIKRHYKGEVSQQTIKERRQKILLKRQNKHCGESVGKNELI